MAKKVTYEIDFQGRDSVSGVASKIVTQVRAMQTATSGATSALTRDVEGGSLCVQRCIRHYACRYAVWYCKYPSIYIGTKVRHQRA